MKTFLLFVITAISIATFAQSNNIEFSGIFTDQGSTMLIGETNRKFLIKNSDGYKFKSKDYDLKSASLKFEIIGYDTVSGLSVSISAPYMERVIGEQRITVTNLKGEIIGYFKVLIGGKEPIFNRIKEGSGVVVIGDPNPTIVTLIGQEFYSINEIQVGNNFCLEDQRIFNNTQMELKLSYGINQSPADNLSLTILYYDNKAQVQKKTQTLSVYTRLPDTKVMSLSCKYKYLDDFPGNEKVIPLEIQLYEKIGDAYKSVVINSLSKDIEINGYKNVSFQEKESKTANLNLSVTDITPGRKIFELCRKDNPAPLYRGSIIIKSSPAIKSISNMTNDVVLFSPDDSQEKVIVVEGENIDELELVPAMDSFNKIFPLVKKQILTEPSRIIFYFKYNLNEVDFNGNAKYAYYFQRDPEHRYRSVTFKAETPKKPCPIGNFVFFNGQPLKPGGITMTKADFRKAKIVIKPGNIAKIYGNQKLTGEMKVMDENNNLINTFQIYDPKKLNLGIWVENSTLKNQQLADIEIPLETIKDFRISDLPPFAHIQLVISHASDFYPVEFSDYKESISESININSGWGSNIRIITTVPPVMIVAGPNDSTGKWNTQGLPLNLGFGVIKQFRKRKDLELQPFDIGLYITGLNLLSTSNSTTQSDKTKKVVDDTGLSLLLVSEWYILQKGSSNRIPIQVGGGWLTPFNNQKSKFFVVVGISYNLTVPTK
jgi:hypothetical protein